MTRKTDQFLKDEDTQFYVRPYFLETLKRDVGIVSRATKNNSYFSLIILKLGENYNVTKENDSVLAKQMLTSTAGVLKQREDNYEIISIDKDRFYMLMYFAKEEKSQIEAEELQSDLVKMSSDLYNDLNFGIAVRTINAIGLEETPEEILDSLDSRVTDSFREGKIIRV